MSYPIITNQSPSQAKPGRPSIYPWHGIAVNEGFIIPARPIHSVRAQCNLMNKATGKCFKASQDGNDCKVVRVN